MKHIEHRETTETYWSGSAQKCETLNHKAYRRMMEISGGLSVLYAGGAVGGWIASGRWQIGAAGLLLGVLSGFVMVNLSQEYDQKLRDASRTCG